MKNRQKYSIEFLFKSSPHILYNLISTAAGLKEWFADEVKEKADSISFSWNGGTPETAKIIERVENQVAKYAWIHESEEEFFEFRLSTAEISNQTILTITAFANKNDIQDECRVWEHQIKELMHRVGG